MPSSKKIIVIGGGPAGLMAAEVMAKAGHSVTLYDQMPSLGRKFLMAGRGGLNLTHSEELGDFVKRYGSAAQKLTPYIKRFSPEALRRWCEELGQETFIGTSGRIFPKSLKASPLLRAWLQRLDKLGVKFEMRKKWLGWEKGDLVFVGTDKKYITPKADAVILAMGGASWPRLGSDGSWVEALEHEKIAVTPLEPANCGFIVPWTDIFRNKFEGLPLKPVTLSFAGTTIPGEAMITAKGLEGGAVYALSSALRQTITDEGCATLTIDLRPGVSADDLFQRLEIARGSRSLSTHLQKAGGLSPVAIGLIQEVVHKENLKIDTTQAQVDLIKALPLKLKAPASIERAISSAGGIPLDTLDENFMLKDKPGVFAAGEMLDWEAPTGGYLLQATFSTAVAAAEGALHWLKA